MRDLPVALILFAVIGCSTATDTIEEPLVLQAAPSPPTDPRVSEMQVLVSELIDQIEVLNARIKKLESEDPDLQPAAARSVEPSVREATTRPVQQPTRQSAPAPRRTASVPAPASASAGERYKEALVLFGKGQINDSRALFEEVLAAEPIGELADNALYWIGETYFVAGRFREAMEQYRRIETDYSNQNKAPDALLKLGLAQAKLGDLALAQQTMEAVIRKYPYSTAASAAKAEIKRIRY